MNTKRSILLVAALLALVLSPSRAGAQSPASLTGLWDATVTVPGGIEIPFRFELSGSGSSIKGSFFNGDDKVTSTTGQLENSKGNTRGARAARRIRSRPDGLCPRR